MSTPMLALASTAFGKGDPPQLALLFQLKLPAPRFDQVWACAGPPAARATNRARRRRRAAGAGWERAFTGGRSFQVRDAVCEAGAAMRLAAGAGRSGRGRPIRGAPVKWLLRY